MQEIVSVSCNSSGCHAVVSLVEGATEVDKIDERTQLSQDVSLVAFELEGVISVVDDSMVDSFVDDSVVVDSFDDDSMVKDSIVDDSMVVDSIVDDSVVDSIVDDSMVDSIVDNSVVVDSIVEDSVLGLLVS